MLTANELHQRLQKQLETYHVKTWGGVTPQSAASLTITIIEALVNEDATHKGELEVTVELARAYASAYQGELE